MRQRLQATCLVVLGNGTKTHQLTVKLNDIDPAFAKEVLSRVGVAIELVTLISELRLGALAMNNPRSSSS